MVGKDADDVVDLCADVFWCSGRWRTPKTGKLPQVSAAGQPEECDLPRSASRRRFLPQLRARRASSIAASSLPRAALMGVWILRVRVIKQLRRSACATAGGRDAAP